jgi:hypothetical protein
MFSLSDFQRYPTPVIASATIVILSIGAYILLGGPQYHFSPNSPKRITEGYPILGALRFFTARWDFFQHARAQTPSGNFSFYLGKHPIVGISGDKGRQLFFENRDLDFAEGYDDIPQNQKTATDIRLIKLCSSIWEITKQHPKRCSDTYRQRLHRKHGLLYPPNNSNAQD